eukprot:scaffold142744_cov157-Phaeocystis_antarctica.AAC.1
MAIQLVDSKQRYRMQPTLYSLYSHAVRDSMQAIQHLSGASAVEKAGVGTPSTSAACEMTS